MESEFTFKVKGREYPVKEPTGGDLIRIENIKVQLTEGNYRQIASQLNTSANQALDIVDIQATLQVLCPAIFESMKVNSVLDLGLVHLKEISYEYEKQFSPWWKEIVKMMSAPYEAVDEKK